MIIILFHVWQFQDITVKLINDAARRTISFLKLINIHGYRDEIAIVIVIIDPHRTGRRPLNLRRPHIKHPT